MTRNPKQHHDVHGDFDKPASMLRHHTEAGLDVDIAAMHDELPARFRG